MSFIVALLTCHSVFADDTIDKNCAEYVPALIDDFYASRPDRMLIRVAIDGSVEGIDWDTTEGLERRLSKASNLEFVRSAPEKADVILVILQHVSKDGISKIENEYTRDLLRSRQDEIAPGAGCLSFVTWATPHPLKVILVSKAMGSSILDRFQYHICLSSQYRSLVGVTPDRKTELSKEAHKADMKLVSRISAARRQVSFDPGRDSISKNKAVLIEAMKGMYPACPGY